MKTERDLLREKETNKNEKNNIDKEVKSINSISVFLYSFALLFLEYLILELVVTPINIKDYRMNFTLGLLISLILISFITVLYMSEKTSRFRNAIRNSKLNLLTLVVATAAIVYLVNIYLNITILKLAILPIIVILLALYVFAKILEKKIKL